MSDRPGQDSEGKLASMNVRYPGYRLVGVALVDGDVLPSSRLDQGETAGAGAGLAAYLHPRAHSRVV